VKLPTTEKQPATVEWAGTPPAFPKQAGEAQAPWAWVERSVGTERMLNRLEQSQEQTVWVRTRIRHILRRRHKRRGMAKGRERSEYPNH
jgi:hypothetical protein